MLFMVQCCPLLCLTHKDVHWLLILDEEISSLHRAAAASGLSVESWVISKMLVGKGGIGAELFCVSL